MPLFEDLPPAQAPPSTNTEPCEAAPPREGLFHDLPPAKAPPETTVAPPKTAPPSVKPPPPPPKPAIKRQTEADEQGAKRVRFKTIVDTGSLQIAEAMKKIASHIGSATKFNKASKLAVQLVQSGSLSSDTSDLFFEILRSAMMTPMSATEQPQRAGYQELFSVVSEHVECFSPPHQAQIKVWLLWAHLANEFFTDDSFVFSKAANKVKQEISLLPEATPEEDALEAAANNEKNKESDSVVQKSEKRSGNGEEVENDPFGLNELLPEPSKKDEKINRKKDEAATEERLLRERREALMASLENAAGRYRVKWAQTIIDILVKHAIENISKFTLNQRQALENLWASVKEQQIRRKQGKTATGKLDVTGFERLQSQYSRAKISIRRAVGADGDRSAEQWLG